LFACGCSIAGFLAVLQFAELREPQPAYGFGSAEITGTGFLSDAVDRWRKYSRAEVRGASPVKNGDL
jgi:hypothetical protein